MNRSFAIFTWVLLLTAKGYSQCTPLSATGNPGLSPPAASVTCIEQGVPYDFTMYFENFSGFNCSGFSVNINSATIDNLSNLPCGLTWQADQASYSSGGTGCIRITGTTTDAIGQYALEVSMTFDLDILGSSYVVSGTIAQLQQQLQQFSCSAPPVNTNYYSRVVAPGTSPCPAIGTMINRTSSGTTCPPPLSVTTSGDTTICEGSSAVLRAIVSNATAPVTYSWSPTNNLSNSNIANPTASPTITTTYSVTATDQNGSASTSVIITVDQSPLWTAGFTTSVNGNTVSIIDTTTNATETWNFGDGSPTVSGPNPPPHAYSTIGTFSITLQATNNCGTVNSSHQVTIAGILSVSISGNDTICNGSATMLTANVSNASGAVTYSWSSGGGSGQTANFTPPTTDTYSVTVTDQNGSATASATVTVISPCNDNNACTTDNCVPATGCVYTPIASCNDNDACTTDNCVPATGCVFTAIAPCDDNDACTTDTCDAGCVYTPIVPCTVRTGSIDNSLPVEIYPNPTSGAFDIKWNNIRNENVILNIFDLSGKMLHSETFTAENVNGSIQRDLSGWVKGIYVLKLSSGEIAVNRKLVIY